MQTIESTRPNRALRTSGAQIAVLKFGSSVLRSVDDLPSICGEIQRHIGSGRKVVAVISALQGETDNLLMQARLISRDPCLRTLPKFVLSGEERAACLVALACESGGMAAEMVPISELGLKASGHPLASTPRALDPWPLTQALASHDVIVVPGFGARCVDTGRHVLLGRGGSDLTAVLVAAALRLKQVRLIKDVDGIYTEDPKAGAAARIAIIGWAGAKAVAGRLIQSEAIALAERWAIEIEVGSIGSDNPSVIGRIEGGSI